MSELDSVEKFVKAFEVRCFNCDEEPEMVPFNPSLIKAKAITEDEILPMRFDCPNCEATVLIYWRVNIQ
jgi:hypothetical protein